MSPDDGTASDAGSAREAAGRPGQVVATPGGVAWPGRIDSVTTSAPPEYVEGALAVLDEHGLADPTFGISIRAACAGAGVARSTIYRRWETVADLNRDLALAATCHVEGWQRQLIARSPDEELLDAVMASLEAPADALGPTARTIMCAWPRTSVARLQFAQWEQAWHDELGRWLEARLATDGRAMLDGLPIDVLALAIAAMVDGQLLFASLEIGPDLDGWDAASARRVASAVVRIYGELTVADGTAMAEATGGTARWVPDPPPGPLDPARAALAARIAAAVSRRPGSPCPPMASRLADIGRVARRLGVTERRVFDVWPTTRDMNLDLAKVIAARMFRYADDLAGIVLGTGLEQPYETFDRLLISSLDAITAWLASEEQASIFATGYASIDEEVQEYMRGALDGARAALRTLLLAALSMTGWYRRSEVSGDEYTAIVLEGLAGVAQLAVLHEGLAQRTVTFRGTEHPLLGTVGYFLARSVSTEDRPGAAPAPEPSAPPLRVQPLPPPTNDGP